METTRTRRTAAAIVVLVTLVGACTGDDDGADDTSSPSATTAAVATAATSGIEPTTPTVAATPAATAGGPSGPACAGVPPDAAAATAAGAVASVPELTTLAEALSTAGLLATLDGPGPFTVFAPVDDAFAAVPDVDAVLDDPDRLTPLLALHVVEGQRLAAADLLAAGAVTALGGDLGFGPGDDGSVVVNGTATVVCADLPVANGIVHLLDAVVLPPVDEEAVGGSVLSTVDLTTGEATRVGPVGTEVGVLGLALTTDGSAIGLTDAGELITFDPADPAAITSTVAVTGVEEGSTLLAIDLASDGSVVAVSDTSAVYRIDPGTGVASPLGTIEPPFDDPGIGLDVGADGALRLAVATGRQVTVDGGSTTEGAPTGGARLVALAGDGEARYGIDSASGTLVAIDAAGAMRTVGPLGVDLTDGASFDIAPDGTALLVIPG